MKIEKEVFKCYYISDEMKEKISIIGSCLGDNKNVHCNCNMTPMCPSIFPCTEHYIVT